MYMHMQRREAAFHTVTNPRDKPHYQKLENVNFDESDRRQEYLLAIQYLQILALETEDAATD